ncbi:Acid sphingomyelinase-like phosphodiesterase 3a [Trichoplax sp. H2]|nr:Acid sphingomyelinase-like phosphodiesterase 3a [Trichoplax sp. H2]|eukprot:RDD47884.1 Acid sphingomyelinase-like phosphodiesterase 3a [Trichoplax sp. H2]
MPEGEEEDKFNASTPLIQNSDKNSTTTPSKTTTPSTTITSISHDNSCNFKDNIFDDEEIAMIGIRDPPFVRRQRRRCTAVRCLACLAFLLTVACVSLAMIVIFYNRVMPSTIADDGNIARFYHLTDFHLDLEYNSSWTSSTFCRSPDDPNGTAQPTQKKAYYGRVGCDSPKTLIDNSLLATKVIPITTQQYVDFVLVSGDFVCHRLYELSQPDLYRRVRDSITYTSTRLVEAFPATPVFPAIGNNDMIGDYIIPVNSQWYETIFSMWSALILCPFCPDRLRPITSFNAIRETFLQGGYYKVEIYDGKLAIISLNTLYWDTEALKRSSIPAEKFFHAADQQLAWFRLQLEIASNKSQSVIIEGHVPPGVDTYLGSKKNYVHYWFDNYTDIYTHYVASLYPHVIMGQFFAHMHKDDFRLLRDYNGMSSFMLLAPSISPIYSNNPSFRMLMVDKKEWKLLDYIQYYLDMDLTTAYNQTEWAEGYRFSTNYPSKNKYINTDRIEELSSNLINPLKVKYWLNYAVARQSLPSVSYRGKTSPISPLHRVHGAILLSLYCRFIKDCCRFMPTIYHRIFPICQSNTTWVSFQFGTSMNSFLLPEPTATSMPTSDNRFIPAEIPNLRHMPTISHKQKHTAVTTFMKRRTRYCSKTSLVCLGALFFFGSLIAIFLNYLSLVNTNQLDVRRDRYKQINESNVYDYFIHLTDIHLDPYYDSNCSNDPFAGSASTSRVHHGRYGRYGCDSSPFLVNSAFQSINNLVQNRNWHLLFFLISGDLIANRCSLESSQSDHLCSTLDDIYRNLLTVTQKIESLMNGRSILFAVGNHDIPIIYLQRAQDRIWYRRLLTLWQPMITCSNCSSLHRPLISSSFESNFLTGGYYQVQFVKQALMVVTLNTLYWDQSVQNRIPYASLAYFRYAGDRQMNWLRTQLQTARRQRFKVVIQGHLPPGVNIRTSNNISMDYTWVASRYVDYIQLVSQDFDDIIVGQFFGSLHRDDFRLASDVNQQRGSFILISPSLSPIYNTNPAYRLVLFEPKTFAVMNYLQYFLDLELASGNETITIAQYPLPSIARLDDIQCLYRMDQILLVNLTSATVIKSIPQE